MLPNDFEVMKISELRERFESVVGQVVSKRGKNIYVIVEELPDRVRLMRLFGEIEDPSIDTHYYDNTDTVFVLDRPASIKLWEFRWNFIAQPRRYPNINIEPKPKQP